MARSVLLGADGPGLSAHIDELGRTVGEEMLEPTRIYTRACLTLAKDGDVHALSHITGGGLAANIARVLPEDLAADIHRDSWAPQPVFSLIADLGGVERGEMERTFNMGIGMVAVVPEERVDATRGTLDSQGIKSWVCGRVREREPGEAGDAAAKGGSGGAVTVRGDYRSS